MIREARPADRPALERIQTRSLPEPNPALLRYSVERGSTSNRPWVGDAVEHEPLVLVSVHGGDPVGYVLVLRGDPEAYVAELAVAENHRREGRGRLLFVNALDRLADHDAISLTVQPGNDAALALYRDLGFVETERLANYYGEGKPAVEMRRDLS